LTKKKREKELGGLRLADTNRIRTIQVLHVTTHRNNSLSSNTKESGSNRASGFRRTRNMLRKSDRFLPPQAEEDEAAVEGEQDADEDAVCRSIRPTMSGGSSPRAKPINRRPPQAVARRDAGRDGRTKLSCSRGRRDGGSARSFLCRPRAEAAASPVACLDPILRPEPDTCGVAVA